MKAVLCIFLALVCISGITSAQQRSCPNICPLNFDPKCGFNGYCYRQFSNACDLSSTNCRSSGVFRQVDLALCQQASGRGGRLRAC